MGLFLSVVGMKNAACCSGLFHPHIWFDSANIRNNIQTCKHSIKFLRFIFIIAFDRLNIVRVIPLHEHCPLALFIGLHVLFAMAS